jgi:tripartite-type tricarboxylate transporter receptor subunit TctC
VAWVSLFTTAGTPAEIVGRLNAEVNRIIRLPGIAMNFDEQCMTPAGGSPADFGGFISGELRRWKDAARAANVSAE